ncbi:phage shock protein C (PspC) family protein [Alteribacillus persepolensis]|uniref:Phage shock protein C (PspC) family protein n=1 Tax=Alteribacillus persepolensis TaxID=568899 RepID=A0A1G8AI29_9BACI|nr:PspC domain-containing protein [Alteribacillus persepolensis]SDH20608.1 phage shock protein C (PspC) family protein [Alteribacillus persepolensis]
MKKLYRSKQNRMLAGVCGGIANYFNVDPTLIRIITVVIAIITWGLPVPLAYIVLAIIMPNEGDHAE